MFPAQHDRHYWLNPARVLQLRKIKQEHWMNGGNCACLYFLYAKKWDYLGLLAGHPERCNTQISAVPSFLQAAQAMDCFCSTAEPWSWFFVTATSTSLDQVSVRNHGKLIMFFILSSWRLNVFSVGTRILQRVNQSSLHLQAKGQPQVEIHTLFCSVPWALLWINGFKTCHVLLQKLMEERAL